MFFSLPSYRDVLKRQIKENKKRVEDLKEDLEEAQRSGRKYSIHYAEETLRVAKGELYDSESLLRNWLKG